MPTRLLFLLTFLAFPLLAHADLVKVDFATGTNASAGEQATATQLVRTAVSELGHDLTEDASAADYTLRPNLLKLGEAYVLSVEKVVKGRVQFSTELKAAHLDELDKVATRVTRAVIAEERSSNNPRVGEITDQEAKDGTQRRPARQEWYLGFGGTFLSNLQNTSLGYSFGTAFGWDINRAVIKLMGNFDIAGSAFLISTALGADVFLTLNDIAPYLGADFGYGFSKADGGGALSGETANGFQVGLGAGIRFLRTSVINVDIGVRAGFLLADNSLGKPGTVSARLGLYF